MAESSMKTPSKGPQKRPNFLMVGTTKAGTSSIYNYLKEHPDAYMPALKEPRFFIADIIKAINDRDPRSEFFKKNSVLAFDDYIKLFAEAGEKSAVGEASPQYLYYYETAIPAIKKVLGDVNIIIVLRNPVQRAFSAYQHLLRDRYETLSFPSGLEKEATRRNNRWSHSYYYMDVGLYHQQVKAYLTHFTRVKIMLFDDLVIDAQGFMQEIYRFLDIDPSYVPNLKARYNVSGIPRTYLLHDFLHNESRLRHLLRPLVKRLLSGKTIAVIRSYLTGKNMSRIGLAAETHERMQAIYAPDIGKLQNLIGRDLSIWLKQAPCAQETFSRPRLSRCNR